MEAYHKQVPQLNDFNGTTTPCQQKAGEDLQLKQQVKNIVTQRKV